MTYNHLPGESATIAALVDMCNATEANGRLHFLKSVEVHNEKNGKMGFPKIVDPVYLRYTDPYLQGRQAQLWDLIHTNGSMLGHLRTQELLADREAARKPVPGGSAETVDRGER